MSSGAGLHVVLLLSLLAKGQTAMIQTQQTVEAAVGEDACFSCQLLQPKEVHQVTWQKVLPEGKKNVATYSQYFGSKVSPDFKDKVEVKDAGLQNCSIVIRDVSEQDGGCYLCLFNSFPDGALTGKTCLQLYELHEPTLHVRESDSSEESAVSCSATGRPAPTVTLTVSQPHLHLSHHNTVRVNNDDSTVTVTTTAVLSGFPDNGAQVGCAARVLSGHKEVWMMIPEVKQTSADGQTAVVQTQQTVDAAVGEDARLSCQLLQPKEVHQVTWQKVLPEEKKNVATYSKRFGSRVNSDFKDKVEVKDAGLQNCSILHEPTLHVRESDSSEESVVSCSATGRPAPTVTLTVSQPHLHLSHHNTVRVNNNDSTVTVTTTAVLSGFPDNGSQVGCAARVLSGHKEVWMMIPEVKQTSADGFDEESASGHRGFTGTWIGFVLFSCVAAAVFFTVLLKHHHKNRPQIPLVTPESNPFRLSTAPEQHEETSNPELPSATARRFLFD
ncbi:hypothetical protein INR49_000956 [Caranx melampygus]|nr:hypothetical protein INR49_000956 [Caranx melampygus]